MCTDYDLLAGQGAGCCAQHQVECVLGVDGQARDLGRVHGGRFGNVAGLLAVAVKGETDQVGGCEVDGVPLEDHAGLGGIATAEVGSLGLGGTEGVEYLVLEGAEGAIGFVFGGNVAGDGDVDNGARRDVRRQKDGGELDLGDDAVSGRLLMYLMFESNILVACQGSGGR